MSFDTRAFRHALGCFPTGVVVVTAAAGKDPMGITVNSFASVSLDPPLVLWCMDRKSSRYQTFTTAKNFTISVLGSDHEAVSVRLAKPGEHELDGLVLVATEAGPPGLADALALLECAREAVYDAGDHAIIVGRVERFAWHKTGAPLVFFRGRYGALADNG
ncbi:MAG: flavin reductase family protein [Alphaproteobacteria bacterium]|nr:flavin reductase family protein [Alphaproteobacteria bacterium]MDE2162591.1 flavin reductase family protein [Alphaproteobacteria bacterium]MDE2266876.1 flavin reductase family protein [Alphaproteobacteria bacterium]MDE2500494.1 flavin reductase family protein [Alphaproteobacteria bacterium]